MVGESLDHGPALPIGAGAADAELILDRGVTLQMGRVAGVEEDAHGHDLASGWRGSPPRNLRINAA